MKQPVSMAGIKRDEQKGMAVSTQDDNVDALTLGHRFFDELVKPSMEKVCPEVLETGACGIFGNGSECFGMDDVYSRDHHWGPSVSILLPDELLQEMDPDTWKRVAAGLPDTFKGFKLEKGLVGTAGLAPDGIGAFLTRTIGRTGLPETATDWLDMPEEDIAHVVNGEVWHDGSGEFTHIRSVLLDYYPDDVWKRRIAHWCRYASGMGLYAMRRAIVRKNMPFCFTAFSRTLKMTMELAFLLNRRYFPYDKWLYPCFLRLDKLASEMTPLIEESTRDDTSWERRIHLLEQLHDLLDDEMVELGLVSPHPKFKPYESSGYRLLERGYRELLKAVPEELAGHTPLCDQVFLEQFVTGYVAGLDEDAWLGLLNLEPE
jgi:hypothetical protein